MFNGFLTLAADPATENALREATARHVAALRASAGRGDRGIVARAEQAVAADPTGAFAFAADGHATLTAAGSTWPAGRFETPSLGELRRRAANTGAAGGPARLWVLDGAGPATDIGALQATTSGRPLFQVASQFNCLESPGPYLARVADYFNDYTQGPRASVSAFTATLLRHYAAPDAGGGRFVQGTGGRQIDLLADVFRSDSSPVRSGYLTGHGGIGADKLLAVLEAGFDRIRVGVHDDAPVLLGYDWDGAVEGDRRIGQVFTSTVAGGGYGGSGSLGSAFEPVCRQLLRAAYLGTVLAAVSLGRSPVVLTLIGGGVFGNPVGTIWDAILWAFDQARPVAGEFDVVVNGRDLVTRLGLQGLLAGVRGRGGAVIRLDREGLVGIER
jgi:hypothetical protein